LFAADDDVDVVGLFVAGREYYGYGTSFAESAEDQLFASSVVDFEVHVFV
jgi:hypothetical protein